METSVSSPNLAATALALLILTDMLPAAGSLYPASLQPGEAKATDTLRHRRNRP